LLIDNSGTYFIDRKFDFYISTSFPALSQDLFKKGATILDGEMVRHLGNQQAVFQIFDCICVEDQSYVHLPFVERMAG